MAGQLIEKDLEQVKLLAQQVLGAQGWQSIARLGGMTNHTYAITLHNGESYVVRLPGEGTEELIRRADEEVSTRLACRLGIDAELLYFGPDGCKVTRYIPEPKTMCAETLRKEENLVLAARVLRVLHTSGEDTKVPFEVFDMAASYESIIRKGGVALYDDYEQVKATVMGIKDRVDSRGKAPRVPCHNDPLCENWVRDARGRMYLIDWEYAGMNDGMWDLADVSIEADYSQEQDDMLLEAYFSRRPTGEERERFQANKLYLDYLWTLWGKTRVPFDGEVMEAYALERYARLKENLEKFSRG